MKSDQVCHIHGSVSVVMPAYNEAHHILANLREASRTLAALGVPSEIIIVDDGSQDATWAAATEGSLIEIHCNGAGSREPLNCSLRNDPPIRILQYHRHRGKGHALACGANAARGDYLVFLDADFDLHPSQLSRFFEIMEQQNADIVIGSKLHPESEVDYPWTRRVMSFGYYCLVRMLFGLPVRDTQTGLKVFKTRVLQDIVPRVHAQGFAFDVAVLAVAHLLGYKICEAPIRLEFRRRYSRIKIGHVLYVAKETLEIFWRQRILRFYARPSRFKRPYQPQVELVIRRGNELQPR